MIGQLRKKFILINMTLVSLVLAVVAGVVVFSTAESARRETENALYGCMQQREPLRPEIAARGGRGRC